MRTYNQIRTKDEQPTKSGWYSTDKGNLYFFAESWDWSCRDDKVSIEHPMVWYKEIPAAQFKASVTLPTDEDINEGVKRYLKEQQLPIGLEDFAKLTFKTGAKWLRDKVQQEAIDPVAFVEWIFKEREKYTGKKFVLQRYEKEITVSELLEAFREELRRKK